MIEKVKRKAEGNRPSKLIGLGIAIGVPIGLAMDNIGAGIAVGIAIGAACAAKSAKAGKAKNDGAAP